MSRKVRSDSNSIDTRPSPFISFLNLLSPIQGKGQALSLPQRVYAVNRFLVLSVIEIITGLVKKFNLRLMQAGLIKFVAKVFEQNKAGVANATAMKSFKHAFKKRFFVYVSVIMGVRIIEAFLRFGKNHTFLDYNVKDDELSRVEKHYAHATKNINGHAHNRFEQERSQGDTLPKTAKSFFILTQKMVLIGIDVYLYWAMLPSSLFFMVIAALAIAGMATYLLAKPETEVNSTRKNLSRLFNEAKSTDQETLTKTVKSLLTIRLLSKRHKELLQDVQKDLEGATTDQQRLEQSEKIKSIITSTRSLLFLEEKIYSITSDFFNSLIQDGFNCMMIFLCALRVMSHDKIGNKVLDIAWMTSTLTVTKDAYKNLLDNIKQIRTYEEFKKNMERVTQSFPQHETYFSELASNLSEGYFSNAFLRFFIWSSTAFYLTTKMFPSAHNIELLTPLMPYLLNPWAASASILIFAFSYRVFIARGENIDIGLTSGRFLGILLFLLMTFSNLGFILSYLKTHSLLTPASFTKPLLLTYCLVGATGYLFDKYCFQKLAFIVDILLIFMTQTTTLVIHNLCYGPEKLYRMFMQGHSWLDSKIRLAPKHETHISQKWLVNLILASLTMIATGCIFLPNLAISMFFSLPQYLAGIVFGSYLVQLTSNQNTSNQQSPIVSFLGACLISIMALTAAQYSIALILSGMLMNLNTLIALPVNLWFVTALFHKYCFETTLYLTHQTLKVADTTLKLPLKAPAQVANIYKQLASTKNSKLSPWIKIPPLL
ncbi:MAG: hypothetical protein VXW87_02945 [Pseudomonadota bacterium]|nr:hypothetical protein [Pseudomonadota bacterium]